MFASISYSDKERLVIKNATKEKVDKVVEEAKKDYILKEKARITNRNKEVIGVIYKATRKPKYIWD